MQQLIDLWNTFESEKSKIKYLATLSNYLDEKYDQEQEAAKTSILNGLFENKNVSDFAILEQDVAGVCADHHRLVAKIAESMGIRAWLVSVTSTWLHGITWLKTEKGFALIDYGIVIEAENATELMAKYYALRGSVPRPYDIVTDASWKVIWRILTPLWKILWDSLSAFRNADWSEYAKGIVLDWVEPHHVWSDIDIQATNQNQSVIWKYGDQKGRFSSLLSWKRIDGVDSATTGIIRAWLTYKTKKDAQYRLAMVYNRIKRESITDKSLFYWINNWDFDFPAQALWISFGHQKLFWIEIWDFELNWVSVTQLWISQDFYPPKQPWFENAPRWLRWNTAWLIWSNALSVATQDVKLSHKTTIQWFGTVENHFLPNQIDDPLATLTIKPEFTVWWKIAIKSWKRDFTWTLQGTSGLWIYGCKTSVKYNAPRFSGSLDVWFESPFEKYKETLLQSKAFLDMKATRSFAKQKRYIPDEVRIKIKAEFIWGQRTSTSAQVWATIDLWS